MKKRHLVIPIVYAVLLAFSFIVRVTDYSDFETVYLWFFLPFLPVATGLAVYLDSILDWFLSKMRFSVWSLLGVHLGLLLVAIYICIFASISIEHWSNIACDLQVAVWILWAVRVIVWLVKMIMNKVKSKKE